MIEFLRGIKPEFENTLACFSGARMGSNHEKIGGQKSSDTLPLLKLFYKILYYIFFIWPLSKSISNELDIFYCKIQINYTPCSHLQSGVANIPP